MLGGGGGELAIRVGGGGGEEKGSGEGLSSGDGEGEGLSSSGEGEGLSSGSGEGLSLDGEIGMLQQSYARSAAKGGACCASFKGCQAVHSNRAARPQLRPFYADAGRPTCHPRADICSRGGRVQCDTGVRHRTAR